MHGHPCILIVAGAGEGILELRSYKPLLIVRRRIDEMAEDFFLDPLSRTAIAGHIGLAEFAEPLKRYKVESLNRASLPDNVSTL